MLPLPLHPALAAVGLAAVSIPIILHLLLKPKPKIIVFPAMQFIKARTAKSTRRLRIQHLLLMLLRCLMVAMMGCALSRPRIQTGLFGIDQKAPVAAMLVFDNSMSMQYRQKGKTRLELAKESAKAVLDSLPEGSQVSVIETGNPVAAVPLSIASARARIEKIELDAASRATNASLLFACRQLAKSELGRREVYVFTDRAAHAWNIGDEAGEELNQAVELAENNVRFYAIDLAAEKPENIALGDVKTASQIVATGSRPEVTINVLNSGPASDRAVTFTLDGQPRETRAIALPAGQPGEMRFELPPLAEGVHQGTLTINAGDEMPFDDRRDFTLEVRPPTRCLTVVDDRRDALHWSNALAPEEFRVQKRAPYEVEVITPAELPARNLAGYDAVALLNVAQLPEAEWRRLLDYVKGGGGLFTALGERVKRVNYSMPAALEVLPAEPLEDVKITGGVTLTPDRPSHPMLAKFRDYDATDLSVYPVLRYYKVKLPEKGTTSLVPYSNGDPGLLERTFEGAKAGRSLMLTTAAHYRPDNYWTELPRGWSYLVLADQMMKYLSGETDAKLNFLCGTPVPIEVDAKAGFPFVAVTDPEGSTEKLTPGDKETAILVKATRKPGHYRIDATAPDKRLETGFSMTVPLEESALDPLEPEKLAELIGKSRFSIAADASKLEQAVDDARVGRELFSWLMILLLAAVVAEGYISNRFYRRTDAKVAMG